MSSYPAQPAGLAHAGLDTVVHTVPQTRDREKVGRPQCRCDGPRGRQPPPSAPPRQSGQSDQERVCSINAHAKPFLGLCLRLHPHTCSRVDACGCVLMSSKRVSTLPLKKPICAPALSMNVTTTRSSMCASGRYDRCTSSWSEGLGGRRRAVSLESEGSGTGGVRPRECGAPGWVQGTPAAP
jgi:hypothetical protein